MRHDDYKRSLPSRSSGFKGVSGLENSSLLHDVLRAWREVFYGSTKRRKRRKALPGDEEKWSEMTPRLGVDLKVPS